MSGRGDERPGSGSGSGLEAGRGRVHGGDRGHGGRAYPNQSAWTTETNASNLRGAPR